MGLEELTLNIRRLDLNLLVVFNALMSTRNVTKTADELCLSQSAISQSLRRLRDALGDPLLVRSGNDMLPTERALAMVEPVNRILRELEQVLTPPDVFDPANSQRNFMIRAPEYFECTIYPRLYEVIAVEAPGVSVDLNYLEYDINESELLNQETDLIFGIDHYMPRSKNLHYELLPQDALICMVANSHLLQSSISTREYASHRHVYDNLVHFMDIDTWLKKKKFKPQASLRVESYTAVVSLVERTDFVAVMPKLAAEQLSRFGDVRLLSLPKNFPQFRVSMIWHPLYDTDMGLQWLRHKIKQIYTDLLE